MDPSLPTDGNRPPDPGLREYRQRGSSETIFGWRASIGSASFRADLDRIQITCFPFRTKMTRDELDAVEYSRTSFEDRVYLVRKVSWAGHPARGAVFFAPMDLDTLLWLVHLLGYPTRENLEG